MMIVGQCRTDPVTGLAGRIYSAYLPKLTKQAPLPPSARPALADLIESIAVSVIAEITANGVVAVSGSAGTIS